MPLITTPKGLRYYRFSDRTKRIWQYRLEKGNWVRLPNPIRISDGHDDQYTFGISHFSDPLKEPVVTFLAGGRQESMLEFQWSISDNIANQVVVPDSVRKLANGNLSPVLLDTSPELGAPSSLWGKQWAFLTGSGSNKSLPVELERHAPAGCWEGRELGDEKLFAPTRVAACVNSSGLHLFMPGIHDGSHGLMKACRSLDSEDYTGNIHLILASSKGYYTKALLSDLLPVDIYLKVPNEAGIIIDTALAVTSWNEEPRVFVLTRQKDSPVRHVQECVYDAEEEAMKLRQLTEFDGWVGVGIDGGCVVVAYEDRDEYGINLKTLVWDEEEEWCDGPDIDRWEGMNVGVC
ncbi:hypothetical protein CCMA1212_003094 [Trichoderma ghanense]|uniref:Fucose-specific lectin n=1 Tax=Trichoderma ghanense TaxID=65468 RepID=A0ABY2H987_9HYPO